MTITNIYEQYQIFPELQLHQLRVAAVAMQLIEAMEAAGQKLDKENVILACLLHDMGSILKANFELFEYSPEQVLKWQQVKNIFRQKYGSTPDEATLSIVRELGISQKVIDILQQLGFDKINHLSTSSLEAQLVQYADARVGPYGVVSLQERMIDLFNRYQDRPVFDKEKWQQGAIFSEQLENNLFKPIELSPNQINDHSIQASIEDLRLYEV